MAFIKSSERKKELVDVDKERTDCNHEIQNNWRDKRQRNKKLLVITSVVIALVCIICVIKLIGSNGSPAKQAIKIIEKDYGKNVNITSIFYNEEQNGCIIEFSNDGMLDVACVHLKENTVGYESVYENMSNEANKLSLSDAERQKYAMQIVDYPYDAMWVYDLFTNGTSGSKWIKVQ